jgi:cell division initiation protein
MKISPTAIRQKAFETAFRGFEKKQVTDFLQEISAVMQQINQENLELRSKLQLVEGEAKRLKDVEDSLFRTLKTAEDTGAVIITEATEAADQIIAEANQIAESTTSRAYQFADQLKKQAEENAKIITSAAEAKAKETFREIRESLQGLIKSYDGLLEQREALIKSLKRTSMDTLNQIELSEAHFARIDSRAYQRAMEELSRSGQFTVANISALESSLSSSVSEAVDEPESQVEEDLVTDRVTDETVESMHELPDEPEDLDELPEEEELEVQPIPVSTQMPEPVKMEEESMEDNSTEYTDTENPPLPEDHRNEDPKKSSGSFFDQFD